jgi:hypothetical protein
MASDRSVKVGPRTVLAGDGGLLTVAAFAIVLGLVLLLGSGSHAWNVAGGIGMAAAFALGPLIAWRLHARRAGGSAMSGALLGYVVGWVILFALLLLIAIVVRAGTAVGLSAPRNATAIAIGIVIAVACFAVVSRLDLEALRDLSPMLRKHVWLDVVRLVATVAFVAYCGGVIAVVAAGSDADAVVYTILLLATPAAVGAAVVTTADMMVRHDEQAPRAHLISGA